MNPYVSLAFDFLDPLGWIAERRLRLAMRKAQVLAPLIYLPYRAPASREAVGQPFQDYQQRRFGTQATAYHRKLIAEASRLDIPLHEMTVEKVPDPWLAMMAMSSDAEHASALFDAIYRAIYREGRDVGDPGVIAEILAQSRSTVRTVQQLSENGALRDELLDTEHRVAGWSQNLIPSIRINDTVISGAQPPGLLAHMLASCLPLPAPVTAEDACRA
jgi:predicted DsbA family dithiol-disulfide isomerase